MKQLSALALALLFCSASATALEIGASAGPVNFRTIDGHPQTMDNYGERDGTVVVFLSARSEAVRAQLADISALYEKYRIPGVLFVGVVPDAEEAGEELRLFGQHHGLRFPVYVDQDGAAVEQFGARVLPEFFLLDPEGKLVYHGGLAYLEPAIQLLRAGRPIAVAETPPSGDALGEARPALPSEDPYGTMHFASELIFQKVPEAAVHHCPTVAEASNGDIVCLWYGGSYESADDQALYLARLPKGGCCWTEPARIVWNPGQPPGNAVIFKKPDGKLCIVWGRMEGSRPVRRGAGWSECRLMQRTSEDDGFTWSKDEEIEGALGWLPRNVPISLANGEFVLPISGQVDVQYGGFLLVLQPDGETWQRRGFIPRGEQPTVVQREDGSLLCLMRNERRILQSTSADNGATWTEAELTELKCPDSGIAMTRLDSGRIVLAYNDTDQSDRTPFNLVQSTDGGKTWGEMKILEADWGEFSYPSLLQASDGLAHLVYTYRRFSIKHSSFDEGWLTILERPN